MSEKAQRKTAEWVTFSLSVLILCSLFAYLIFQLTQKNEPYAVVDVKTLLNETKEQAGLFITPIEVKNTSGRTLSELKIEISGKQINRTVELKYLAEKSKSRIYVYFEQEPQQLEIKAKPLYYRLE